MAIKPINITIGAALASTFGSSTREAQSKLQQLGSVMAKLDKQHSGVSQMQKLRESTDQLGRAFAKSKRHSDEMRATLAAMGPPTAAQTRELGKAENATDKARFALTRQRDALRGLRGELTSAGLDTRNLANESVRLGSEMEKLQRRTVSLAKAQNAQQANRDKRGQLVGDMFSMVAVGSALAKPAGIAISFEDQMARVGAVSNSSKEQLEALTEKAREMGRNTRYSATQAGEGMYYLSMAGFNAQQQIDSIGGVLSVAAAANADLGRTADIVSNVLTGFGLEAKESARVGDVLTKTFTSSNTTLESLGETLKYVAPVAKAAGASIELAAAMAGVMGDAGIQGSMAGTAMRSMFTRLVAPAKEAQKHMKQMGITAEQMQEIMADPETQAAAQYVKKMGIQVADEDGNLRDWMDILTELAMKMDNMSEQDALAAAAALFGKPGMSGGLAVLESLKKNDKYIDAQVADMREKGATEAEIEEYRLKTRSKLHDRYNKNLAASQESFASKIARLMEDTTGGSLRVLKSAAENLGIEIGKVLSPSIRSTAENMALLADKARVLVQEFPVLSRVVIGGATAALTLGIAWKALGFAWTVTKAPFLSAITLVEKLRSTMDLSRVETGKSRLTFKKIGSSLASFVRPITSLSFTKISKGMHSITHPNFALGFKSMGRAIVGLVKPIGAVTVALVASPLFWIGAIIAGAALSIYKYWEPLSAFFGGVWDGIGQAFSGFTESIRPLVDDLGRAWQWFTDLIAPVKSTSEEMENLADAGISVGNVIGTVLRYAVEAVLIPLKALIGVVKWFIDLGENPNKAMTPHDGYANSVGVLMQGILPKPTNLPTPAVSRAPKNDAAGNGLKAQPVGNRVTTVTHQPQFNITVAPGTDGRAIARELHGEWSYLSSHNSSSRGGALYDY